MDVLYEKRFTLEANRERVWELITSSEQRKKWLLDLESARLLYGIEGQNGAKIQLRFRNQDNDIIEHVKRSKHLVRLQTEYQIGDRRYRQIFNVTGLSEHQASLHYICHQEVPVGWRKVFSKAPPAPSFLQPINLENLDRILGREAMSAVMY